MKIPGYDTKSPEWTSSNAATIIHLKVFSFSSLLFQDSAHGMVITF